MANGSGICYTWSGDKKIYEPDLFKADIKVKRIEYCYRCDLAADGNHVNKTLVWGKLPTGWYTDEDHAYLPCFGLSINHNIQANGEDHYNLSGTYEGPQNWSPPAGVEGPFQTPYDLKHPYYEYTRAYSQYIHTWYGNIIKTISQRIDSGKADYYGIKK